MNVLLVSNSDLDGGAARAAYRLHRSLVERAADHSFNSRMRVIRKLCDDSTVLGGPPDGQNPIWRRLQPRLAELSRQRFSTSNPVIHSSAWPFTGLGVELQRLQRRGELDLLHLHWLGDTTLSIEELGRLQIPIVWTLHDQWAFCGAEHYTTPPLPWECSSSDERFAVGYSSASRPAHEDGPDLNRRVWLRKRRAWRKPMHIICPSQWLADCARRSTLMQNWPITVIPNPIDLNIWAPFDKSQARALLGLPNDRLLVSFGALGGINDPRKGADLLLEALQKLRTQVDGLPLDQLELVVFGQSRPSKPLDVGFPIHYMGLLHDDISLRLIYAAADVFVIPSRQDNLPNTGLEAQSCGTPVVAFRTCGLVDIVEHQVTGALADPFDTLSLAHAIHWVLVDNKRRANLRQSARQRAESLWSPSRVTGMYKEVYMQQPVSCT